MANEFTDPKILVNFPNLDRKFDRVVSYSLESGYLTSTDGFSLTLYHKDRSQIMGLEQQSIEITIDGALQLLGRVDRTEIGGNGSSVVLQGRDYISDLIECNVDPTLKIKKGMSLFEAITLAASPVGVDSVVSDGDLALRDVRTGKAVGAPPAKDFKPLKTEDLKPNAGEGIYEFCNRMVARFGGTIQPGLERSTLLLTAPNYSQDPLYSLTATDKVDSNATNNIKTATAVRDHSSFPTFALFQGKESPKGKATKAINQSYEIDQVARIVSAELERTIFEHTVSGRRKPGEAGPIEGGRLYRLLFHKDNTSKNIEQLERAALRAVSERLKETLRYSCTVRGHKDPQTGALWSVDTIVEVNDDIRGVHEPLWILDRKFTYSASGGAETQMEMVRVGAIQL